MVGENECLFIDRVDGSPVDHSKVPSGRMMFALVMVAARFPRQSCCAFPVFCWAYDFCEMQNIRNYPAKKSSALRGLLKGAPTTILIQVTL